MVALIPVISTRMKFLALASTFGPMAKSMMASGRRIKCTVKASSSGKTVNSMKEIFPTTNVKATEFSHGEMVVCMRVSGKTVNSMDKVFSSNQITQGELASGKMDAT